MTLNDVSLQLQQRIDWIEFQEAFYAKISTECAYKERWNERTNVTSYATCFSEQQHKILSLRHSPEETERNSRDLAVV